MELNEDNLEVFKSDAKHFAQIDKLIGETKLMMKPFQERLKQLKAEKKELEKEICIVMEANDLKKAELPNNSGILEYQVKQAMVPVTQKTVKEKMVSFFEEGPGSELSFNSKNAKMKGLEIHNYIYGKQNREFIKKETIKSKDLKV
jgi:hypothetical protein